MSNSYSTYLGANRCCNLKGGGMLGPQGPLGRRGPIGPAGPSGPTGPNGTQVSALFMSPPSIKSTTWKYIKK